MVEGPVAAPFPEELDFRFEILGVLQGDEADLRRALGRVGGVLRDKIVMFSIPSPTSSSRKRCETLGV